MHTIPVRGPDGLIAAFVDPNAPVETEEPMIEEASVEQPEEPRRPRVIRPEDRKSMRDLLRTKTPEATAHTNRSFTTGLAVGCVALLIAVALISFTRAPTTVPAALPTSVQSTVPTQQTNVPAAVITLPTVGRAIVAYAAPDGAVVGAIAPDRAITLTGTFGSDWMQIEAADSGRVWVHTVDVPSSFLVPAVLAQLPNLAPPTATIAPTAVPVPTSAPVTRPRTVPPASVEGLGTSTDACTPDRVVAIVRKGAQQVSSCVSLADAQAALPGGTVVAANAAEAQAFYGRVQEQSTVLAQP